MVIVAILQLVLVLVLVLVLPLSLEMAIVVSIPVLELAVVVVVVVEVEVEAAAVAAAVGAGPGQRFVDNQQSWPDRSSFVAVDTGTGSTHEICRVSGSPGWRQSVVGSHRDTAESLLL